MSITPEVLQQERKPHIRLHVTVGGWWWAERYRDCKHGWDRTGKHPSALAAVCGILGGRAFNCRGWTAQWPNQVPA